MTIPSQDLYLCASCNMEKPESEITAASLRGERSIRCKECENAYARKWRKQNSDAFKAYYTDWRKKNRDKLRQQSKERRAAKLAGMSSEELAEFRRKEAQKTKNLNQRLKDETFAAYGGYVCSCCGVDQPMFLCIDHVHNDGAKKRRNGEHGGGGSADFYRSLKKSGFPSGYQVLCFNCNMGKHLNGGVCPHKGKV